MPTKHIENHTNAPMYVGGKMIPPGTPDQATRKLITDDDADNNHGVLMVQAEHAVAP